MRNLIWASIAAAVASCIVSCAPGDAPAPPPKKTSASEEAPAERLAIPPSESAAGPRERIEQAIENVRQRELLTTNGFWTVFHGIVGLGPDVILRDPDTGSKHKALEYISSGGELRGMQFIPTKYGLDVQSGQTFVSQGHQDQFIAEMAQWHVAADRPFFVNDKEYKFMDFVRHAKARARVASNQELSWTILVVGQYLGTDIAWKNNLGESLRFEDLVRYEVEAPVETAACGGTHRLFGLSWVYHLHLLHGGQKTGVWKDLADKMDKYAKLARQTQNPDGSFSTDFFKGPGNASDRQLRMNTTGHILEWLSLALSDEEIKKPWMQDAASALSLMFLDIQDAPMEGGTLYHAVHGLLIYYARVYGPEKLGPLAPPIPRPPDESTAKAQ